MVSVRWKAVILRWFLPPPQHCFNDFVSRNGLSGTSTVCIRLYQIIFRRQYHLIFESAGGKLWFGPSWGSIDLIFTCHAQFEGPRSGGPPGPYLTFKTRPTKPYIPPQPLDQSWPLRVQIKADIRGNILSPKNRCRHTLSPNRCRKTKPEPKMQHWFFPFATNSSPCSQSYPPG